MRFNLLIEGLSQYFFGLIHRLNRFHSLSTKVEEKEGEGKEKEKGNLLRSRHFRPANKQEFLRVAVFARAMFVLSSTAESKEPVRACVFRAADQIGEEELARKTFRNIAKR